MLTHPVPPALETILVIEDAKIIVVRIIITTIALVFSGLLRLLAMSHFPWVPVKNALVMDMVP